jgi:hypothetical protein
LDQITALVNEFFMPKMPTLVFDAHPLLKDLFGRGTKASGGSQIRQVFTYNVTADGAYLPYEVGSTSAEDRHTAAQFPWKYYWQHLTIAVPELRQASGPEEQFSYLDKSIQASADALRESLATDLVYTAGATGSYTTYGDSDKQINTLYNLIDDGTASVMNAAAAKGGITPSAANSYWQGKLTDNGAAAISEANLGQAYIACVDGGIEPDAIYSHPDILQDWIDVSNGPASRERYVNTQGLNASFDLQSIKYRNATWYHDRHINTGELFLLRRDKLDLVSHKDEMFTFGGFQTPYNQHTQVGWWYWMGNMTVSDPRRQGMLYGITT